jgi:hypothetical protein
VLFSLRDIQSNYRLLSENEDFGEIRTFLIDTDLWELRYLVVRVGSRDVLLSIRAVGSPNTHEKTFPLTVDREKVINSPEININRRISREMERQIYDYYEWPYDWDQNEVPETLPGDLTAVPLIEMELDKEQQMVPQTGGESRYSHMFSADDLFGYAIRTTNDEQNAGRLHDLVVNDGNWQVMYMVVDTNGFLPGGKKVAVTPTWVEAVDESDGRLLVNLSEESVSDLPEFNSVEDLE